MFEINGVLWKIKFENPNSEQLKRSDGSRTVGVTDFNEKTVFLSNLLVGAFLKRVMAHELCHCFCFSYDIHLDIDEEERMADFIATYGEELLYLLDDIMREIKSRVNKNIMQNF